MDGIPMEKMVRKVVFLTTLNEIREEIFII